MLRVPTPAEVDNIVFFGGYRMEISDESSVLFRRGEFFTRFEGFFFFVAVVIMALLFVLPAMASTPKIQLLVSVDWEGESLQEENLIVMKRFREQFPQLKLLQFLNAAYFTKPSANAKQIRDKIASVIRPGDELGLHIHSWKSLFTASGVSFKTEPTYWGSALGSCRYDCGHEVSAAAYSESEFRKVVHTSKAILKSQGFGTARSFRTGGWMGTESVLTAIAEEGFTVDSSAVPVQFLKEEIGETPLYSWLNELWNAVAPSSQPWNIETAAGKILEVPDNGALADYVEASEMVDFFKAQAKLLPRENRSLLVHIGFHQETAREYLRRVETALRTILALAERGSLPLEFASLPISNSNF